jgi:hypothetical protein
MVYLLVISIKFKFKGSKAQGGLERGVNQSQAALLTEFTQLGTCKNKRLQVSGRIWFRIGEKEVKVEVELDSLYQVTGRNCEYAVFFPDHTMLTCSTLHVKHNKKRSEIKRAVFTLLIN